MKKLLSILFLKKYLPRSLFTRSLLILIAPIILTQIISTYVFFDRHWDQMAGRLAVAVAGEVAFITRQVEVNDRVTYFDQLTKDSLKHLQLSVQVIRNEQVKPQVQHTQWRESIIQKILSKELRRKLNNPHRIVVDAEEKWIQVQVQVDKDILILTSPERRLFSSSGYVFLLWMVGVSAILMIVAVLFMRNQVRPIKRLAVAADWFGKGRDVPFFRPHGAREVRQAAKAFIGMKDRLNRQIQQRTEMLAGVSHDLRTPLTRMKLQLSMMGEGDDVKALQNDVTDMEEMMDAYLQFAKGEGDEETEHLDIVQVIHEAVGSFSHSDLEINVTSEQEECFVFLRPVAFGRCLLNLINNAEKYADTLNINVNVKEEDVEIILDDNGHGIAPEHYDDVFKPFFREDTSRNSKTGGTGLGLSVAREIILAHGGDISLDKSPEGGLRVLLSLPF